MCSRFFSQSDCNTCFYNMHNLVKVYCCNTKVEVSQSWNSQKKSKMWRIGVLYVVQRVNEIPRLDNAKLSRSRCDELYGHWMHGMIDQDM